MNLSSEKFRTPELAFPRRICRTSSSAFIAQIKREQAEPPARAWVFRSQSGLPRHTGVRSRLLALSAKVLDFASAFHSQMSRTLDSHTISKFSILRYLQTESLCI